MKYLIILFTVVAFFNLNASAQVKLGSYVIRNSPGDLYPTHLDSLGQGGFMSLQTIAARNAILIRQRKMGMMVYVQANDSLYKLNSKDLSNSGWVALAQLSQEKLADSLNSRLKVTDTLSLLQKKDTALLLQKSDTLYLLHKTDTSFLLQKSDTSLLLQKVDTTAILAMYAKKFTKDVVVNFGGAGLGKYANGQTIPAKGKTLDEFLYDIVTKASPPTYTAPSGNISASPSFGSYEIGYNPGEITLSYNYNKNDAGDINTRIYKLGSTPLTTLANGTAKSSPGALLNTTTYGVTVNYNDGPIKNNTVNEPDPTGQIKAGELTSSNSFSIYAKRYWGTITDPIISSTITSTSLTKFGQDNSGTSSTFNVSFTENEPSKYLYFAYPNTSGNLNSLSINGTDRKASFTKSTIDLVNDQGYKQSYNIYTSIKRYWGTINSPFDPLTTLDIRTITPKFQDNFGGNTITNLSFTNDNTKFLYFAYPDNLADVTSFIYNGTESIRSFKKTVVNFQNERGTTPYKVYTSIKRYWGLTNQPFDPNTTLDIRTLSPAALQDNSGGVNYLNLNIDITDKKYIYFAFPDGIGNADLVSILYKTFENLGAFNKSFVNIQNDQGVQRYIVYTSKNSFEPDLSDSPILQIKNMEFK
jgi:hypothetical protein